MCLIMGRGKLYTFLGNLGYFTHVSFENFRRINNSGNIKINESP